MNRPVLRLLLLALAPAFFAGCNKQGNFTVPAADSLKVNVLSAACQIKTEGFDDPTANANQFELSYDNSGKLVSVLGTKSPASTIITNTTIYPKQIDQEQDGVGPVVVYDFDQDLFAGQPANYTTSHPNATSDRSVTLQYDASGRLANAAEYNKKTSALIETLLFSYDQSGNLISLTRVFGSTTLKTVYTISNFDDRHNPYDSLKSSNLLMYNWDLFNSDTFLVIEHLSKNNPQQIDCTPYTGSAFSVKLDYQYSGNNYPVQITETNSNPTVAPVIWSYTYDCQKP